MPEIGPKTVWMRPISALSGPIANSTLGEFLVRLQEKEIQFARSGVSIHLLVPPGLVKFLKP